MATRVWFLALVCALAFVCSPTEGSSIGEEKVAIEGELGSHYYCTDFLTMESEGSQQEAHRCDRCCRLGRSMPAGDWVAASVVGTYCYCKLASPSSLRANP